MGAVDCGNNDYSEHVTPAELKLIFENWARWAKGRSYRTPVFCGLGRLIPPSSESRRVAHYDVDVISAFDIELALLRMPIVMRQIIRLYYLWNVNPRHESEWKRLCIQHHCAEVILFGKTRFYKNLKDAENFIQAFLKNGAKNTRLI